MYKNEIFKLFPEPVFKYKIKNFEKLNIELSKYIYDLYDKDNKGVKRSNVNGWHSKNFDLSDKKSIQHKFFLSLGEYVFHAFKHYGWKIDPKKTVIKEMWAIINKKGNFNVIHTHPNCYMSAAYYVKAPKNCGEFIVESPNAAKRYAYPKIENDNELNMQVAKIDISEGDLLLFPSYLPHKVGVNESDEDRIVISFNIEITN